MIIHYHVLLKRGIVICSIYNYIVILNKITAFVLQLNISLIFCSGAPLEILL